MKRYIIPVLVALGLSGGALVGGYVATDAIWSAAYADGVADAGAESAADPASTLPDPAADPTGAAELVWSVWKGAKVPALILSAFLLAVFAMKKWPRLNKGRTGKYLAAAVAATLLIAERAQAGDTPSVAMLVSAIGTFALAVMRFEFGGKEQA